MLSSFSAAWNSLYTKHPSEYKTGSVTITERGIAAKNKSYYANVNFRITA